jgi:hypothetical protein
MRALAAHLGFDSTAVIEDPGVVRVTLALR